MGSGIDRVKSILDRRIACRSGCAGRGRDHNRAGRAGADRPGEACRRRIDITSRILGTYLEGVRTVSEARVVLRRSTRPKRTAVDLTFKAGNRGDRRVGAAERKGRVGTVARIGRVGQDLSIRSDRIDCPGIKCLDTDVARSIGRPNAKGV